MAHQRRAIRARAVLRSGASPGEPGESGCERGERVHVGMWRHVELIGCELTAMLWFSLAPEPPARKVVANSPGARSRTRQMPGRAATTGPP